MKGRNPGAAEKRYHDKLCQVVGCIACHLNGIHNTYVSVHHVDGRTKPMAHWLVLPLCAGHHQQGTGAPGLIGVHPYKAQFEAKYGRQQVLIGKCAAILAERGEALPLPIQELTGVLAECA